MSTGSTEVFYFTIEEAKLLSCIDSLEFGFITSEDNRKITLIQRAVDYFDTVLATVVQDIEAERVVEENKALQELTTSDQSSKSVDVKWNVYLQASKKLESQLDPIIYLLLGHYQLILKSYDNALSAYLRYESLRPSDCQKDVAFLYGLGLCYFYFNAFKKASDLFHNIIYIHPSFHRIKEVHIRLGYIYKLAQCLEKSHKHYRQAIRDKSIALSSNIEIHFHIAHLFEYCRQYRVAEVVYQQLLNNRKETVPSSIRHLCLRQLALMKLLVLKPEEMPTEPDIRLLERALQLDSTDGETWYLLGRCQASLHRVQDAFASYRSSIDKTEPSADTWCSIGVLYQEQNQPMDALQAYFCALQLDKCHVTAWANVGTLYESMQQYKEALKCYSNAVNGDKRNEVCEEIKNRLSTLQNLIAKVPERMINTPQPGSTSKLPLVEEAWSLPIPAELIQRQMQQLLQESSSGQKFVLNKEKKALAALVGASSSNTPALLLSQQSDLNRLSDHDCKARQGLASLELNQAPDSPPPPSDSTADAPVAALTSQEKQSLTLLNRGGSQLTAAQRQIQSQLISQALRYHMQVVRRGSKGAAENRSLKITEEEEKVASPASVVKKEIASPSADDLVNAVSAPLPGMVPGVDSPTVGVSLPEDDFAFITDEFLAQLNGPEGAGHLDLSEMEFFSPSTASAADTGQPPSAKRAHLDGPGGTSGELDVGTELGRSQMVSDLHAYLTRPLVSAQLRVSPTAHLHIGMTGKQLIDSVRGLGALVGGRPWWRSVLPEGSLLPAPPKDPWPPASLDSLHPPTPSIYLENRKDAHSSEMMEYCLSQPVVVVRNLASTLRMDLSLFSTKSLVDAHPGHPVEVRKQRMFSPDDNSDAQGNQVWYFNSPRTYTTIAKYAAYQANSFIEARKEDKFGGSVFSCVEKGGAKPGSKQKMIRFGTNCDLSEEKKWFLQLHELNKLPVFTKFVSAPNMLSHVGYHLLGMNTVQLYMKVPGSRTPGHQENNNFCSVNINIGPGECEWFNVPEQYWGTIHRLCEKHNVDYLTGSWWPVMQDLIDERVPVYRFIQRPGDLVFVNAGTVHWVQAIGWCNNIAWNVGPMTARQYQLAIERYEYNKLRSFKSIVPMVHLSWQLAKNVKITDAALFELIKHTLLQSMIQSFMAREFVESLGVKIKHHGKQPDDVAHLCHECEVEVFNILYVATQDKKFVVRCLDCARKMQPSLAGLTVLAEYNMHELIEIYDNFQLQKGPMSAYPVGKA